jgi:hypothetical protein
MADRHDLRRCKLRILARVNAFLHMHAGHGHSLEHNDNADTYEPYVVRCTDCHESLTITINLDADEAVPSKAVM